MLGISVAYLYQRELNPVLGYFLVRVSTGGDGIGSEEVGDEGGDQGPEKLINLTGAPWLEFLCQEEILLCS